jgi:hypothetical protein
MKSTIIFWDTAPCNPLKVDRRFGGAHCLHRQGRISRARYQSERTQLATCFHAAISLGLFDPEDGGDMFLWNVFDFQQASRRYIPEDSSLHNHRCENLNSYVIYNI